VPCEPLLTLNRARQLREGRVEGPHVAKQHGPANVDAPVLDAAYVGVVGSCAPCQLDLRDAGADAELAQRSTENLPIYVGAIVRHQCVTLLYRSSEPW
jgi:hypothetical protein